MKQTKPKAEKITYQSYLKELSKVLEKDALTFFTPEEISEYIKITTQTVIHYIKTNQLEALTLGKGYRIAKGSLARFINERTTW